MNRLRRRWRTFLAWTRLDLDAVCDASLRCGLVDYHDYPDDWHGEPWHFVPLQCRRCGKVFVL